MKLYEELYTRSQNKVKSLALLIDPDKYSAEQLKSTLQVASNSGVTFILVGGSLTRNLTGNFISEIKKQVQIPVYLFPGNLMQLSDNADGILLLSLISGRNPEYLIGNHVHAAPFLRNSKMDIISTGYILIETGKRTSVEYVSNTLPIPSDKTDLAVATAIAGEILGMKLIYLEGGSGARETVNSKVVSEVKRNISIPLIVGGGIKSPQQAEELFSAGADIIVVGNTVEENPGILYKLAETVKMF